MPSGKLSVTSLGMGFFRHIRYALTALSQKTGRRYTVAAALVAILLTQPAHAEDLKAALAKAYMSNPTLLAARAGLRATDESLPQALSGWRPTISVDGSVGKEWNNDLTPANFDQEHEPKIGEVKVTQPLFSGFGTMRARDAAEQSILAGRARLLDTEQQVLLAAVTAYMQVRRDRAILELNKSNERLIAEQLDATQKRFDVGEVTRTDIAQAEARLQGAIASRVGAEGNLATSTATYKQVIGDNPGDLSIPDVSLDLPKSLEEATILSLNSLDISAARFDERAAEHQIGVATAEMLPQVSVTGSWQYSDEAGSEIDRSSAGIVALQVEIPLYQAGAPDSKVREAKQRRQQAFATINEVTRSAEQRAQESWQATTTAEAQIKSFTEQVRATDIALTGVQQEQVVGQRTVLDVLNAEVEALQAKVNLAVAESDLVIAKYRMAAAIGQLTAASLGLDVSLYDPTANYQKVRDKFIGIGIDDGGQ